MTLNEVYVREDLLKILSLTSKINFLDDLYETYNEETTLKEIIEDIEARKKHLNKKVSKFFETGVYEKDKNFWEKCNEIFDKNYNK